MKNSPSVFGSIVVDSVCRIPSTPWVWSGEMHGSLHRSIPPYRFVPSGMSLICTAGSSILIPTPAGTATACPSTNTSRWAWTWFVRNSLGCGFRPALTVRPIGSAGAGQTGPALPLPDDGDDRTGDAAVVPQPTLPNTRPMTAMVRRLSAGRRTLLPSGTLPVRRTLRRDVEPAPARATAPAAAAIPAAGAEVHGDPP